VFTNSFGDSTCKFYFIDNAQGGFLYFVYYAVSATPASEGAVADEILASLVWD
jgi:hypothetical protein